MWRAQPSCRHGTQRPPPCNKNILPARCEPWRSHGLSRPLGCAGHGPHFTGSLGPNKVTTGTSRAAARWVIAVSGPM